MRDYLKSEKVLKGNLQNLYTVLMALFDTEVKNQIQALPEYKEFDKKLDSMMLLKAINKILYTGGSNNLHAKSRRYIKELIANSGVVSAQQFQSNLCLTTDTFIKRLHDQQLTLRLYLQWQQGRSVGLNFHERNSTIVQITQCILEFLILQSQIRFWIGLGFCAPLNFLRMTSCLNWSKDLRVQRETQFLGRALAQFQQAANISKDLRFAK